MSEVIANLSRIDSVLKEWYMPGLVMQLPQDYAFYEKVKTAPPTMLRGKRGYIAVQTGRNHGGGPRSENAVLPDPGSVEYDSMTVNVKYEHQLFSITKQALEAAKTDKASFAEQLNAQVEGTLDALARRCSRWMAASDGSGCLANCTTTTATTTLSLADGPQGFATQHLEEGMVIDILTKSSGATIVNGNGRTIESIDHSAKTVTLDSAGGNVTVTTSEGVYLENSRNQAPMGIFGIIDDGDPADLNSTGVSSLQGKAVSSNPWFKAVSLESATDRPLTIADLNRAWLELGVKSGKPMAKEYTIWSRPELWDEYGRLMVPDRHYSSEVKTTDAGHAKLTFNGIDWLHDRDLPPNRVFFHHTEGTVLLQMGSGPEWVDGPNGSVLHWVQNTLSYKACAFWFWTMATKRRNRNAVIADLKQSEITGQ